MLLCSISTLAQAPDWGWARSAGGRSFDQGTGITTDIAGNVYITGTFTSDTITFGNITLRNSGDNDIFIVKYDPNGSVLWAQSAGGNLGDVSSSITTDAAGNAYLTGNFASPTFAIGNINLTNANLGHYDIFIAKYDPNGNVLWAKSIGGNSDSFGEGITTDVLGNVYLTGESWSSTLTFGNIILTNTELDAIFIVKYNTDGNVLWAKNAGGDNNDYGYGIATDATGNIYLTGRFNGHSLTFENITLTNAHYADFDFFITKYNSAGNVLWAKSIGGSSSDRSSGIITDAAGNAYLTGSFNSPTITFGDIILTNTNANGQYADVFIAKYDPNGNVLWAQSAGGNFEDASSGITTDAAGNVYNIGNFGPTITFGNTILTSTGDGDIFIVKYDPNGNVIWAKSAGGDYSDEGKSITTDITGNVYLTGNFNSPTLAFGNTTLIRNGMDDIFVARLNTSSNAVPEYPNESEISTYPNPATDELTITIPTYSAVNRTTLELFDIYGKLLKSVTVTGNTTTVDISGYPAGVYVVRFMDNKGVVAKRIVKR